MDPNPRPKLLLISWYRQTERLRYLIEDRFYEASGINWFHYQKICQIKKFRPGAAINYIKNLFDVVTV